MCFRRDGKSLCEMVHLQAISSQFLQGDCQGPPTSMYISTLVSQSDKTHLPPFMQFVANEYTMGECGLLGFQKDTGCCYSSLDPQQSKNTMSGSVWPFSKDALPLSAVGGIYCQASNLFGFEKVSILQTDESCIDGRFECQAGNFEIYGENSNCGGIHDSFPITNTPTLFRSNLWNTSFTLQTVKVDSGSVKYQYVAMTPSSMLKPNFKNAWDVIFVLFMAVALLSVLVSFAVVARRYHMKKNTHSLPLLVAQMLALGWMITETMIHFGSFGLLANAAILQLSAICFSITTLVLVIEVTRMIGVAVCWSKQFVIHLSAFAIVVHLALAGSLYFEFQRAAGVIKFNIDTWRDVAQVWEILFFVYITGGTTFLLVYVSDMSQGVPSGFNWDRLMSLVSSSPRLGFALVGQFLGAFGYILVMLLRRYSLAFANDRALSSSECLLDSALGIHLACTAFFIERTWMLLNSAQQSWLNARQEKSIDDTFEVLKAYRP
ncbi:hypothetical protein EDD86DRAFT_203916 [Gorgonomyces haynaldii]|nr:hypothetical protein EDD86DRAFT_203916 [Gorgonomyces haynaldii]